LYLASPRRNSDLGGINLYIALFTQIHLMFCDAAHSTKRLHILYFLYQMSLDEDRPVQHSKTFDHKIDQKALRDTERGMRFGLTVAILTVAVMLGCIYASVIVTLIS
jgi:hypothetical protein